MNHTSLSYDLLNWDKCKSRYDGQRAQIHKLVDGSIHVFSRNGDESTLRFPDLIDIIKESCKPVASTFIIDAEVQKCFQP